MKTVVLTNCESAGLAPSTTAAWLARIADYLELTKPRIAVMALLTVAAGYALGASAGAPQAALVHVLIGVALVAGASSAGNQWLERHSDARMNRTARRPLPSGRLTEWEVLAFTAATGLAGIVYLALCVNALTALLAGATFLLYVGVYTPLKKWTALNTVVGAVPGALPPVLGWTAATGSLSRESLALFAILFLWQFPHFMAIAWIYRDDYARGGMRMLTTSPVAGRTVGLLAVVYAAALFVVAFWPQQLGLAGSLYGAAAGILGILYLAAAIRFWRRTELATAKSLLWASLVHLPMLFLVLVCDHFRLLS